jgi:hypothetical protein
MLHLRFAKDIHKQRKNVIAKESSQYSTARLDSIRESAHFTGMEHHYLCPYCWQENDIFIYPDDGETQQMIIDCRV